MEAAREMLLRGDFVTGRVNGVPFYDKPPLALWTAALGFAVFGFHEWVARLPVAIASTSATLVTYWLGSHISRRVGLFAAAFFALNPIVLGTGRQMTMDLHQTWWVAAAMLCGYQATRLSGAALRWWMGFWTCCGLGFMAKSFPGLLPVPVMLCYLWMQRRGPWRERLLSLRDCQPLLGVAVLAAVVAPWHTAAILKDRRYFVEEYWTLHHVGILRGTEFGHGRPIWYYVPVLAAAFFPWSFVLPLALRRPTTTDPVAQDVRRLASLWAVVGFVLFSLMRSKLVSYLLPIFPALAVVTACGVNVVLGEQEQRASRTRIALCLTAAAAVAWIAAGAGLRWLATGSQTQPDPEAVQLLTPQLVHYARAAVATIACGLAAAALFAWRDAAAGVWLAAGTMGAFTALTWQVGLPAYDRAVGEPLRRVVACAARSVRDGDRLIVHIGRPRRPSVFFYLPDRMLQGPLPPDPRRGLLLEEWSAGPVRAAVRREGAAFVLADYQRGCRTFADGFRRDVLCRSGRWALFHVTPEAGGP